MPFRNLIYMFLSTNNISVISSRVFYVLRTILPSCITVLFEWIVSDIYVDICNRNRHPCNVMNWFLKRKCFILICVKIKRKEFVRSKVILRFPVLVKHKIVMMIMMMPLKNMIVTKLTFDFYTVSFTTHMRRRIASIPISRMKERKMQ